MSIHRIWEDELPPDVVLPERDHLRERQLVDKHGALIRARWIAEGRPQELVVAVDHQTGRITACPSEMPPTPSVALLLTRASRHVCTVRRVRWLRVTEGGVEVHAPTSASAPDQASSRDLPEGSTTMSEVQPPATLERRSYRQLTRQETFRLCKKLEELLHPHPDQPGRVYYDEGWTDMRVANEVIPDYPGSKSTVVGKLRSEVFGLLPETAGGRRSAEVRPADPARLAALEERCRALESVLRRVLTHCGFRPEDLTPEDLASVGFDG